MPYEILLPVSPVPCPRPRMTRNGHTYYSGTYTKFKAAASRALPAALFDAGLHRKLTGPLLVAVSLKVTRPKTTKLPFPKPDVDNYAKSVLDALNGHAWVDDDQVIGLVVVKEWAPPGEGGSTLIRVQQFTPMVGFGLTGLSIDYTDA